MVRSRNIMVLIIIVLVSLTAGCSRQSAEKKPSENGQTKKAPTELKSLASDLDTTIAELDKKIKARSGGSMQQNIELNPQPKSTESQNGQSGGAQQQTSFSSNGQSSTGQSSSGQQQNNQKQGSQSANTQKQNQSQGEGEGQPSQAGQQPATGQTTASTGPTAAESETAGQQAAGSDWQKEFTSLRKIHESWNSLMPEAVEAGMSIEARNQFSTALEQLTQAVTARQPQASMTAALELFRNYANLARFFSASVPAELYQEKYEVMASVYEASQKNWAKAEEHVPKMLEQWLYLGAKAKDADAKMLSKTEFSIMDLQSAIKTRQPELIMIKGEIAMTNLNNLQAKLSSQSSSSGHNGGSSQSQSSGQGGGNSSGQASS